MNKRDERIIERIRKKYEKQEVQKTKLDELVELDEQVKRPVNIFSYIFGGVGSLVLGTGMCMAMGVIGGLMPLGIVIGLAGIAMTALCYPLHKKLLGKRKEKYSSKIMELSKQALNEKDKQNNYTMLKTNTQQKSLQTYQESNNVNNNKNKTNSYER